MIIPMLGLGACAAGLTPLQERAWDAFKDCQRQAHSAMLQQISEDGGISYTTREGGDFLHRFRVTLDRNAKQMRLEPLRR